MLVQDLNYAFEALFPYWVCDIGYFPSEGPVSTASFLAVEP